MVRRRENRSVFENRRDAGVRLAARLSGYRDLPGLLVLALPRGGVPVAYEVARALSAPLDVFLVRKLGAPGHEELAMGAIARGGVRVLNREVVRALGIPEWEIEAVAEREERELERREHEYREGREPADVVRRTVIVVDDGLATGSTMHAAVSALRRQGAGKIVVAVPVGAPRTCGQFERLADAVVCLETPQEFEAVGEWYEDFSQTTDDEVRLLLQRGNQRGGQNVTQVLQ
jgi:predicted phosphoribosyltransferase